MNRIQIVNWVVGGGSVLARHTSAHLVFLRWQHLSHLERISGGVGGSTFEAAVRLRLVVPSACTGRRRRRRLSVLVFLQVGGERGRRPVAAVTHRALVRLLAVVRAHVDLEMVAAGATETMVSG